MEYSREYKGGAVRITRLMAPEEATPLLLQCIK